MDIIAEEHHFTISKREFVEEWFKHTKEDRLSKLYELLASKHDFSGITQDSLRETKKSISRWCSKIEEKWKISGKKRDIFLPNLTSSDFKLPEWLEGEYTFKVTCSHTLASSSGAGAGRGRPRKSDSDECSDKTKKRRVEDLVKTHSANDIVLAAEVSARACGKRNLASVIRLASESPEKCSVVRKTMASNDGLGQRTLSRDEALAYYVDSKSTSHSYKQTRKWSIKAGHQVFPSYYSVRLAKQECLPPTEKVLITDTRAEIELQSILNKTVQRLMSTQLEVIKTLIPGSSSFTLVSKWGCDGSSGHSTYKQKFTTAQASDEFLFVFNFVPLQLCDESGNVVWQNPRPSSTRYCRPIKFIFSKETTDFTITETNSVLEEISKLVPTVFNTGDTEVSIKHQLLLTMVDGKVCNALTQTSSAQKCFICGATPKQMNDETRDFVVDRNNLGFGISPLHAWIRCFECLLHISYRLEIKKWQNRDEDKPKVKQRTESIRQNFKLKMGLIVDKPKSGFGNSNDGNTARRFFGNPELSSEITGLDVNIIKKFDILLRTLASGFDKNLEKFKLLAQETKSLYLSLYSWYYMPVTVHKILVHSVDLIQSALLPIGQLSEEAQEARNKDCRRFREHNSRKCSRIATNKDLLNMLLITSDPVINSLREIPKHKTGSFPPEVLELISPPKTISTRNVNNNRISDNDYLLSDSEEESDSD